MDIAALVTILIHKLSSISLSLSLPFSHSVWFSVKVHGLSGWFFRWAIIISTRTKLQREVGTSGYECLGEENRKQWWLLKDTRQEIETGLAVFSSEGLQLLSTLKGMHNEIQCWYMLTVCKGYNQLDLLTITECPSRRSSANLLFLSSTGLSL